MKKYIKPELEIELLAAACDIITASGGDGVGNDSFDVSNPPSFNG